MHTLPHIEARELMFPTRRATPFSDKEWLFEWKYDGLRCLVRKEGECVDLISRSGKSFNDSFPEIVDAVAAVPGEFVWDGELTVDEPTGHPSLRKVQGRARTSTRVKMDAVKTEYPARLYVFDILASMANDLRSRVKIT
jgi:bifunctional non-homologous end joining protein LigD